MQNDLGLKLIAVMDAHVLKLYAAQGLKIVNHIKAYNLADENHASHIQERHQGFNKSSSGQSTFFDPHTSAKDIENQESAKSAIKYIEDILEHDSSYKELIIVASSKMLGEVRSKLNKNTQKLTSKEIAKDLVHHDEASVEKAVFG